MLRQAHITPQAPTETFQNYQQPSPAASATLFYRSADVQSSASQATVVCPDSSSYQTAPTTQAYTTFESLFPVRQFSNLSNMPTSILLHYLVHSFIWATSVLRGLIRENPVNYLVDPADQAGRAILMPTPLWPGGDHTLTSPLDELLQDMIPIYAILLTRGSFTYWLDVGTFTVAIYFCSFFEPRGLRIVVHIEHCTLNIEHWTLEHLKIPTVTIWWTVISV